MNELEILSKQNEILKAAIDKMDKLFTSENQDASKVWVIIKNAILECEEMEGGEMSKLSDTEHELLSSNLNAAITINKLKEELEILRRKNERLKEGLRFYADIDNARVTSVDDIDGEYSPTMSGGLYLTGKHARQVLKECEEMEEGR